jgi:hypothetical protein
MVKEGQIQEALVMYQKALDLNHKLHGPERYSSNIFTLPTFLLFQHFYSSNIFILYVLGLIARLQQTDIIVVIILLLCCYYYIFTLRKGILDPQPLSEVQSLTLHPRPKRKTGSRSSWEPKIFAIACTCACMGTDPRGERACAARKQRRS